MTFGLFMKTYVGMVILILSVFRNFLTVGPLKLAIMMVISYICLMFLVGGGGVVFLLVNYVSSVLVSDSCNYAIEIATKKVIVLSLHLPSYASDEIFAGAVDEVKGLAYRLRNSSGTYPIVLGGDLNTLFQFSAIRGSRWDSRSCRISG